MSAVGQANPFSDASEFNMLDFIIARATDEMQTVSVGEVIAVNTGAQTVDVQILVNLVTGANTPVEHEVIAGRPYFRLQGGGNAIICDPVVGDIGVVVFASRDITGVVAAKSAANPSSNRRFSWSDGIYLGGILNGAPTQYMQFLAAGGGINIVSPGTVAIQAPATTASGTLNVTGNTTLQATLAVTGTSTLTGAVSAPGGLTTTTIAGASAVFSGSVTASSFIGGGGGGGGTVTSVGISTPGVGVVVGGGPVTTAGTLTVDLSSTAYAALALAVTALQSISIATGTGLTGGPLTASGTTVALSSASIASLALANTALQSISIATGTGLTGGPLTASGTTVALSAATIASLLPSSPVQGDIVYYTGSAWANLAPGTAGQILQTGGAGANPSWITNTGASTPVPGTIPDLTMWVETDNILGAGGALISRIQERTPWITGLAAAAGSGGIGITIDTTQLNSLNVLKWPTPAGATGTYVIQPTPTGLLFNKGCTIFYVVKGFATAGSQALIGAGASNGTALYLSNSGGGAMALVKSNTAVIGTCTTAWSAGTWFQGNVTYNPTTGAFAFRQVRANTNSGTGATLSGTVVSSTQFGSDESTSNVNGASLAALIAYNRVLSGTEIANVEAYLLAKWGV